MIKGIILINKNDTFLDKQAEKLQLSFADSGCEVSIVRNNMVLAKIKDNQISLDCDADFCIFLDKDIEMARMMESAGIKLFNSPVAISLCDDKMQTYIALSGKEILIPDTCSLPIAYREPVVTKYDYEEIIQQLGRPFVLKENNSSLGLGVFLIKSFSDFVKSIKITGGRYLAQRYIEESFGKDLRIIVIGKKAVAWMRRVNYSGDFRSGISTGGIGEIFDAPRDFIEIAEKCATILELDYCGVDLLFSKEGPMVAEVNSNASSQTIEKVTGIRVTDIYVRYILDCLKHK